MIDLFTRWAKRQFLDLTPATCYCCKYLDKHTEMAWVMWVAIWKYIKEQHG